MENIIVFVMVVCIIGSILWYIYREKKRGITCIGCPYAKQCSGNCSGGCDQGGEEHHK